MPTITFRRDANIDNIPVIDGQILFDTSRNIILMDNGNTRNQYAGSTQLISTTPQATNTNAYNAVATNQIFLQKTTVIDTKANALAVTQQYIPLGCLAFKEAIGTSDYSNVGNGTISGALVTINNQLNNQLTVNDNKFYFDYHDGKYGYNTNANRGADTFFPFNTGIDTSAITQVGSGTYTATKDGYYLGVVYNSTYRIDGWPPPDVSVGITVNNTAITLLANFQNCYVRYHSGDHEHYAVARVGYAIVKLNVGDVIAGTNLLTYLICEA